ncbi:MAG: hypothetical protein R6V85_16900 [Polyangia bacterium]
MIGQSALLAGCGGNEPAAREEFERLERALVAYGQAPPDERGDRLETVRAMEISSQPVQRVREICISAYRELDRALAGQREARKRAEMLEIEVAKVATGSADASAELDRMHREALSSVGRVDAALDRAEARLEDCQRARNSLRRELEEN